MKKLARWLILGALAGCGSGEVVRPAVLIRCSQGPEAPCGQANVELGAPERVRLLGWSSAELADAWRLDLGDGRTMDAMGEPLPGGSAEGRILILLDVSGSMKGPKIGASRLVLRQFLRTLDSVSGGRVAVAVVPFGSVQVAGRVGAGRFVPALEAAGAVDALPQPAAENTALYSAVVLASHRLRDEIRAAPPGTVGALVVITDGNNDVRAGDDPGLLAGESGVAAAAAATSGIGGPVGIIGIGDLDRAALERLAGSDGRVFPIGGNPTALDLAEPLGRITSVFQSRWSVGFRHPAPGRRALGRGPFRSVLLMELDGIRSPVGVVGWRPPLVALPAYAAGGPRASGPPDRAIGVVLIGVVLLVLMAELWVMIPRLLWPTTTAGSVAGSGEAPVRAAAASVDLATTIQRDAQEAPPRKLSDVTASRARREG